MFQYFQPEKLLLCVMICRRLFWVVIAQTRIKGAALFLRSSFLAFKCVFNLSLATKPTPTSDQPRPAFLKCHAATGHYQKKEKGHRINFALALQLRKWSIC